MSLYLCHAQVSLSHEGYIQTSQAWAFERLDQRTVEGNVQPDHRRQGITGCSAQGHERFAGAIWNQAFRGEGRHHATLDERARGVEIPDVAGNQQRHTGRLAVTYKHLTLPT